MRNILKCQLEESNGTLPTFSLRSKQHMLIVSTNKNKLLVEVTKEIAHQFEMHTGRDSGVLFKWALGLHVTLPQCGPVHVLGLSYIPLPFPHRSTIVPFLILRKGTQLASLSLVLKTTSRCLCVFPVVITNRCLTCFT